MPQALPREDPDFDLRLIQPTAVSGRGNGRNSSTLRRAYRALKFAMRVIPAEGSTWKPACFAVTMPTRR
jgi:hypothetical protein